MKSKTSLKIQKGQWYTVNLRKHLIQWLKGKGQSDKQWSTMIYKTLHRKLKYKQHKPHSGAPEV